LDITSSQPKTINEYIQKSKNFWHIVLMTLPLDWLAPIYVNTIPTVEENEQNPLLIIYLLLFVSLLTTQHQLILKLIILNRKLKFFVSHHKPLIIANIIFICFIIACTICFFSSFFDFEKLTHKILFSILGFLLSIIYPIAKTPVYSYLTTDIKLDEIYNICISRLIIPRLLSLTCAFYLVYGDINSTYFIELSLLSLILISNAEPRAEHFCSKCKSCGKETLYGSTDRTGRCIVCQAQYLIKPPKMALPVVLPLSKILKDK